MSAMLHHKLIHAATEYDRRQQGKRGYNVYALGHYLGAIERAEQDIDAGATVRAALVASFNGRLLDTMLKAAGESISTDSEQRGTGIYQSPVRKD